jgi:O-antigen ligase
VANIDLSSAAPSSAANVVDLDFIVRSALFLGVLLSIWISFHPFQDLSYPPSEVTEGGDRVNQIAFSLMLVLLAAWSCFNGLGQLKLLLRPTLIAVLLWCALTVLTSWEPSLAARRFAFTLVLMSISGMMLLLPRNIRHFADLMAAVVLIVLAACYLGVFFAPAVSIHHATDFLEPEHAGSWRGVFPHKNEAGASMVLIVFVGMFVARMRSFALGGVIIVLALTFLFFTHSKTPVGLLIPSLLVAALLARIHRPAVGIAMAAGILVVFNLFSVGSIYFEPVREIIEATMSDPSFTGRTDIWRFAFENLVQRPIMGYGFSAFWGTEQVVFGLSGKSTWANAAADAHNAYLNLALAIGLPGLALVLVWIVILPLADYYRHPQEAYARPLQSFFLRVCLFSMYASCFESTIFQQVGPTWVVFLTAAFGLRFLSLSRAQV